MNDRRKQPSLELFDILNGSEDDMRRFADEQSRKLDALTAKTSKLETNIYILQAQIKCVGNANAHARWLCTRKVNAVALKEFRDPAKIREYANFEVDYDDDDIFDEEFYATSYAKLKTSGYDPETLFKLAEYRKQHFSRQLYSQNVTELGAYDGFIDNVKQHFKQSKQHIDSGDVFSACYLERVGMEARDHEIDLDPYFYRHLGNLDQQIAALHRSLNDMRAKKLQFEAEESNLASKSEFYQDLCRHLMSTCRKQQLVATRRRRIQDALAEKLSQRRARKPSYEKPWRITEKAVPSQDLWYAKKLSQLLKESSMCKQKLALDYDAVHANAAFQKYKTYSYVRVSRFLVDSTDFLADLRWMFRILDESDALCAGSRLNVFITE